MHAAGGRKTVYIRIILAPTAAAPTAAAALAAAAAAALDAAAAPAALNARRTAIPFYVYAFINIFLYSMQEIKGKRVMNVSSI